MATDDKEQPHEIVIVRKRGGDDHDEHHGGVWKVAFADFMTAMMAFFLVLWIVNSTTKQTRSSLARYFNPIRLSDTTPARKGLNDPREVDFDASSPLSPRDDGTVKKEKAEGAGMTEAILPKGDDRGANDARPDPEKRSAGDMDAGFPGMRTERRPKGDGREANASSKANETALLRKAIESIAGEALGPGRPDVLSVTQEREGLLISLTDHADLGNFAVGSSSAESRLNRILAAIAVALGRSAGAIVVRGHTDSRPYRGGQFDNWRLSFARAQTAFFGLVKGGLDEKRIERVEAYADRKPRNPENPNAPENRRIEILLKQDAGR